MSKSTKIDNRPGVICRRLVFGLLLSLLGPPGLATIGDRSAAGAAEMEILTPPPSSTVIAGRPEVHLVLRLAAGAANQVRVEFAERQLAPVAREMHQEHDYFHFRLPLNPGRNLFTLQPGGRPLELNYHPRPTSRLISPDSEAYLFHRTDRLPPACLNCHDLDERRPGAIPGRPAQESCAGCHQNLIDDTTWQHSTFSSQFCLICHQQDVEFGRIGLPAGKIEDTCLACHTGKRPWLSRRYLHGPINDDGCTVCHNPHGEKHRHQLWAEGSWHLCVACHEEKVNTRPGRNNPVRFFHGIIGGAGCLSCHDAHAADQPFLLPKPVNELCVSCHPRLAGVQRGHPVSGHPVAGPVERRRPNRELSCVSCHDPHGSPFRYMLFETPLGGYFCNDCHK